VHIIFTGNSGFAFIQYDLAAIIANTYLPFYNGKLFCKVGMIMPIVATPGFQFYLHQFIGVTQQRTLPALYGAVSATGVSVR
jgi:hypothetical protein